MVRTTSNYSAIAWFCQAVALYFPSIGSYSGLMPPDFVSTQQAAELLGIHESRVRALAAEGRIRGALKVGRAWIIPLGADGKPKAKILLPGRPPKGKARR